MNITELINSESAARHLYAKYGNFYDAECCPHCGASVPSTFYKASQIRCKQCNKKYNWKTGTMFQGTKLPVGTLILLIDYIELGIQDQIIATKLKLKEDTVSSWRFRVENN